MLGCSGTSRKTRIETAKYKRSINRNQEVAVELPEKQGLKHQLKTLNRRSKKSCSGTSRKTRIETNFLIIQLYYWKTLQWNFQKNKD